MKPQMRENAPVSKNMTPKDYKDMELKLLVAAADLKAAHDRWTNMRLYPSPTIPVDELREMEKEMRDIGERILAIAEDLSAGPATAWNY